MVSITLDDGTEVTLNGTAPFEKRVTGMMDASLEIYDSTGALTNPQLHGQAAGSVYANTTANNVIVDEIVTKANAA